MITLLHEPVVLSVRAFEEASQSVIWATVPAEKYTALASSRVRLQTQAVIDYGITSLKSIQKFDVAWHQGIFEGSIPYRESDREVLVDVYHSWYVTVRKLLAKLDKLGSAGLSFPETAQLRTMHNGVAGLLTPDDEFFEGVELDMLAENAIHSAEQGETVEMREMGD